MAPGSLCKGRICRRLARLELCCCYAATPRVLRVRDTTTRHRASASSGDGSASPRGGAHCRQHDRARIRWRYLPARGPEIGVASTIAFTWQIVALALVGPTSAGSAAHGGAGAGAGVPAGSAPAPRNAGARGRAAGEGPGRALRRVAEFSLSGARRELLRGARGALIDAEGYPAAEVK